MKDKEAEDLMALDLFDLAQEWVDNRHESLYRCPKHKKAKKARFGCSGCVRERDEAERLRAEAREALPDSFLELIK